jgi:hypothetical protein
LPFSRRSRLADAIGRRLIDGADYQKLLQPRRRTFTPSNACSSRLPQKSAGSLSCEPLCRFDARSEERRVLNRRFRHSDDGMKVAARRAAAPSFAAAARTHVDPSQLPLWVLGGVTMAYAVLSLALFQRKHLRRFEREGEGEKLGLVPAPRLVVANPRVWKALTIRGCNMIPNCAVQGLGNFIFIRYRHFAPISARSFSVSASGSAPCVAGLRSMARAELAPRLFSCILARTRECARVFEAIGCDADKSGERTSNHL